MTFAPIQGAGAGTSVQELENIYDRWATSYERDMNAADYKAPENVANAVPLYFKPEERPRILDMAAGKGVRGEAFLWLECC